MKFNYKCTKCEKDKWSIEYNTDTRLHSIECAQCGYKAILEEIFSPHRRSTNVKTINKNVQKTESRQYIPTAEN